ncbi:succinate dehydrogenase assembly factor 2 [Pseudofrancisella aestuarii]|uniref:FAD assembly factor SdhE n=1 Tax=Pseudofrancisella aestuarii TaxID=2670347 RepID=A0ABV9T996_9GAMM|nr:succinate dehydrogenase assembly factor 2 [Pseudofrancisella aestuarii]
MLIKSDNPIFYSLDKIKYSARRGMLELDIMLKPYLEEKYIKESIQDKKLFIEFLTSEDNDMFDWLFRGVKSPAKFESLVKKIIKTKKEYNEVNLSK